MELGNDDEVQLWMWVMYAYAQCGRPMDEKASAEADRAVALFRSRQPVIEEDPQ